MTTTSVLQNLSRVAVRRGLDAYEHSIMPHLGIAVAAMLFWLHATAPPMPREPSVEATPARHTYVLSAYKSSKVQEGLRALFFF